MVNVQETLAAARNRRPFTILGVMIALLTLASFIFVASRAGDSTQSAATPAGTVAVVVARNAIHARQAISAGDLEVKNLAAAPVGSYSKLADIGLGAGKSKFALIDIPAGQPVVANGLGTTPGDSAAAQQAFIDIAPGYVAFTIPTSEQQGVAGSIKSGDYIGIVATLDLSGQTISKTVFANVLVLQTGVGTADVLQVGPITGKSSNASAQSLTVMMTECDVEYLSWFLARAALRYVLLSSKDYPTGAVKASTCTVDQAKGVTPADIASRFGIK